MKTAITADLEKYLADFFSGYVDAALWSSTDSDSGLPLDENYSVDDIDADSLAAHREECEDFILDNIDLLARYHEVTGRPAEHAGHDFWLTRERHGAGFWDRGAGDCGDKLAAAACVYGGNGMYADEEGRVYFG